MCFNLICYQKYHKQNFTIVLLPKHVLFMESHMMMNWGTPIKNCFTNKLFEKKMNLVIISLNKKCFILPGFSSKWCKKNPEFNFASYLLKGFLNFPSKLKRGQESKFIHSILLTLDGCSFHLTKEMYSGHFFTFAKTFFDFFE